MNNTEFKNNRYIQDDIAGLLYSNEQNIAYADGTSVNAIRLNNTFKQLVDNDKIIEHEIIQLSNHVAGPKKYNQDDISEQQDLYNAENGYKVWLVSSNNGIQIGHKVDNDLQKSITQTELQQCDVYKLCQTAGTTFAATNFGLFTIKDDGSTSQFTDINGIDSDIFDIEFYDIFNDGKRTLFATSYGIFELNSTVILQESESGTKYATRLFLCKRNKTNLSKCHSIFVRKDDNTIFVGTENGVYFGKYNIQTQEANIEFDRIEFVDINNQPIQLQVNSFDVLSPNKLIHTQQNDVISLTDKGIYLSKPVEYSVNGKEYLLQDKNINFAFKFQNKLIFGTDNGLIDSNSIQYIDGSIFSYTEFNGILYIGSSGTIYKVTSLSTNTRSIYKTINLPNKNSKVIKLQNIGEYESNGINHRLILILTDLGEILSLDTYTDTICNYDLLTNIIDSASSNKMMTIINGSDQISTFNIENAAIIDSDNIRSTFDTQMKFDQNIDILQENENTFVVLQNQQITKFKDNKPERITQLSNATQLIKLKSSDEMSYACIDNNEIIGFSDNLTKTETQISSFKISDTNHLLVGYDQNGLFSLNKNDMSLGTLYVNTIDYTPEDLTQTNIVANGRFVYTIHNNNVQVRSEIYDIHPTYDNLKSIQTNDNESLVLKQYTDKISLVRLSSGDDSEDFITSMFELPGKTNYATFDGSYKLKVASDNGISTLYLSVDDNNISNFGVLDITNDISGEKVFGYHKVNVPHPYEYIATETGLSVNHDEYVNTIPSFGSYYGLHIADTITSALGTTHTYYAIASIYDSVPSLSIIDNGNVIYHNDELDVTNMTFSFDKNAIKNGYARIYVADGSSLGLQTINAKLTVSGDISSFESGDSIGTENVYTDVRCLALSNEQIGVYATSETGLYKVNGDTLNLLSNNFNNITKLDGVATKNLCALIINDDGQLYTYEVNTNKLSSCLMLSNVSRFAIVGDNELSATKDSISVVWTNNEDNTLYSIPYNNIYDTESSPNVIASDVISILKDYRIYNIAVGTSIDQMKIEQRRISRTYIQSFNNGNYSWYTIESGELTPQILQSDVSSCYLHILNDTNFPSVYVNNDGIFEYKNITKKISNISCYNVSTTLDGDDVTTYFMTGNNLNRILYHTNSPISELSIDPQWSLNNIETYSLTGNNISFISAQYFYENLNDINNYIKLYQSDINICPNFTDIIYLNDLYRSILSTQTIQILLHADDDISYEITDNSMTLDTVPELELSGIDELFNHDNEIYIRKGSEISSFDGLFLNYITDLNISEIAKTFALRSRNEKPMFIFQSYDGWKYALDGDIYKNYTTQILNLLDVQSYTILNIQNDIHNDNSLCVITDDGIYGLSFSNGVKIIPNYTGSAKSTLPVVSVNGHEDMESNSFQITLSNENGQISYGFDANNKTITTFPNLTYNGADRFEKIGCIGNSLDSNMMYAVSGDLPFLTIENPTNLEIRTDERIRLYDAEINSINVIDKNTYICTDKGVFVSYSNNKSIQFEYQGNSNSNFNSILTQNDLTSILAGHDGLYTLVNRGNPLSVSIYKNSLSNDQSTALVQWNFTGSNPRYAYSNGNEILTSDNCKTFDSLLRLPDDVFTVYSILPLNQHDFFFGTDNGVYMTQYAYELCNDFRRFSASDARNIYDNLEQELDSSLSIGIQNHIEKDHATSSIVSILEQKYLPTDFKNVKLSNWIKTSYNETSSDMAISNDLVDIIEFGDETTGDITIQLSNFLTSESNAKCSYIIKRYMSGIVEVYIYIPTTNTYYLNHVAGVPGCTKYNSNNISRQNLAKFNINPFNANPQDHCSYFDVNIATSTLSIDTLLDMQINGNSLPLKCYRDKKFPDDDPYNTMYWHSFVEPTEIITKPNDSQPNQFGEYNFKFACFGSDAQALKIVAYDPSHTYNSIRYTVVFNANGAQGKMVPQKFIAGIPQKLRPSSFTWPNTQNVHFMGWTDIPNPSQDSEVKYKDCDILNLDKEYVKNGQVINLYAIWIKGETENNEGYLDNKFILNDTTDELFFNSADILSSYNDKVFINYGK